MANVGDTENEANDTSVDDDDDDDDDDEEEEEEEIAENAYCRG